MSTRPDPDLEKLLSDLSVTRAAVGSVPGGMGREEGESKSDVTGRDYTVTSEPNLGGPPRSITVSSQRSLRSSSDGSKRLRLIRFPENLDLFGQHCCTTIGQGPTTRFANDS